MMEKRGVIDANTPQPEGEPEADYGDDGQPLTKEAADQLERGPMNQAIDAVAERSRENQRPQ